MATKNNDHTRFQILRHPYRPVGPCEKPAPNGSKWYFLPVTGEEQDHFARYKEGSRWAQVRLTFGTCGSDRDEPRYQHVTVYQGGERIAQMTRAEFETLLGEGRMLRPSVFEKRRRRSVGLHILCARSHMTDSDYIRASRSAGRAIFSFMMLSNAEFEAFRAMARDDAEQHEKRVRQAALAHQQSQRTHASA